jgi:hypothetical protein
MRALGCLAPSPNNWAFTSGFDAARRIRLEAAPPFEALVESIVSQVDHIEYCVDAGGEPALLGCHRPVFMLPISAQLCDMFFNGPTGYRAHYLVHPDVGQAANSMIINALSDKLEGAILPRSPHDMESGAVKDSLKAGSAKAWVYEDHRSFDALGEDLAVETWKAAAQLGISLAKRGLSAPMGDTIVIKGAFLNDYGNEVVPARKICRRYHIHSYGFS